MCVNLASPAETKVRLYQNVFKWFLIFLGLSTLYRTRSNLIDLQTYLFLNERVRQQLTGGEVHLGGGGDGQRVFDPGCGVHRNAPVAPCSDLRVLRSHLSKTCCVTYEHKDVQFNCCEAPLPGWCIPSQRTRQWWCGRCCLTAPPAGNRENSRSQTSGFTVFKSSFWINPRLTFCKMQVESTHKSFCHHGNMCECF